MVTTSTDGRGHRLWIEQADLVAKLVTVIPTLKLGKVTSVLFAKGLGLLCGETYVRSKLRSIEHGVFRELVQFGLHLVAHNRYDAGNVGKGDGRANGCVLKESVKET